MFLKVLPPPEVIRYTDSEREIILHRSRLSHAEELVDGIHDSMKDLLAFMPWAHIPEARTLEMQQKRIESLAKLWDKGEDFVFNIFVTQRDGSFRFSGCLGLHPRCLFKHGMEIGYWVRSDAAGQGVCTLAVQMSTLIGFQKMGLKRIQVGCDAANNASRRVIEKVGFRYEGLQRNMGGVEASQKYIDRGWRGCGDTHAYGMIPDDLETLDWVEKISPRVSSEPQGNPSRD